MKTLILICSFLILSCSKSKDGNTPCYECNVYQWDPAQGHKETICTNRQDTIYFMDSNGNALQFSCNKK